jgi:hypothetical protein
VTSRAIVLHVNAATRLEFRFTSGARLSAALIDACARLDLVPIVRPQPPPVVLIDV